MHAHNQQLNHCEQQAIKRDSALVYRSTLHNPHQRRRLINLAGITRHKRSKAGERLEYVMKSVIDDMQLFFIEKTVSGEVIEF